MVVMKDQYVFEGSPFALTATPKIGACWAGRQEVLKNLLRLVRTLTNRPDSTLDLIWADLGAGKSHALYHIAHLLTIEGNQFVPLFIEIPEPIRHFTDLYRRIVSALPWPRVAGLIVESRASSISADLQRSARVIVHGNSAERDVAKEWLMGGHPHLRELRNYTGISARIENDLQAMEILSDIIQVLARSQIRLVLLLDEFQRLGVLQERSRSAILSSLRSLFSRNPSHFSVVAAATTKIQKTALDLLPQELRTLLGMRPSVSLPEMSEEEAYDFVIQRFKCFRPSGYNRGPADPIGEDAIQATIEFISRETNARLIPRTILQALSWIFDETSENDRPVPHDRVHDLLRELSWDTASNGTHD